MDAADPFKRRMEKGAGLPFRDNATSSLYHYDNKSFMLVFGGTDQSGVASNELFLINLTACTWEPLYTRTSASEATETSGGGVLPRCGAASTVVGDKLFIFGGWAPGHVAARKARKKSITLLDTDTINAYSVLDLNTRIWDVQDRPYPDGLDLGYNIDVYAPKVYKGHKLLLMRGRTIENEVGILTLTLRVALYWVTTRIPRHNCSPSLSQAITCGSSTRRRSRSRVKKLTETCPRHTHGTTSHRIERLGVPASRTAPYTRLVRASSRPTYGPSTSWKISGNARTSGPSCGIWTWICSE